MEIKFPFKFYHKSGLGPFSFPGTSGEEGYYCYNHAGDERAQYNAGQIKEKIVNGDWIVTEQPKEKPKHPHHDIIIAWLNGEQIQCQLKNSAGEVLSDWFDLSESADSVSGDIPGFNIRNEYRIKPKDPDVKIYFEVSEGGTIHHAVVCHMKLSEAEKILDNLPK